jgi:hypothetical protein
MTFTDDDLDRLREDGWNLACSTSDHKPHCRCQIDAIIARLEAAEEALDTFDKQFHGYDDETLDAYKAWEKTAGKKNG